VSKERPDAESVTLEDAVDRFLRKRETDATAKTIQGYRSRLDQFLKWADSEDIETVADLDAWTLDEWQLDVADRGYAKTTIKARLNTVRLLLEYIEAIGLTDDLSDVIDIPELSRSEEMNEERLKEEDALRALTAMRESSEFFGTGMHTFLEVAWHVGARVGEIQALDLSDFDADEQVLRFEHRPDSETPLKNKGDGERWVGTSAPVVDALEFFIARERGESRDSYGRSPLFATAQGRASLTTLRSYSYRATQPCLWRDCPHGKRRPTCEWTQRGEASKCPSSRSPHRIRTGSITWQLNMGYPIELVAKRANVSIPVLKRHYDQAGAAEEFRERRKRPETQLDITNTNDE